MSQKIWREYFTPRECIGHIAKEILTTKSPSCDINAVYHLASYINLCHLCFRQQDESTRSRSNSLVCFDVDADGASSDEVDGVGGCKWEWRVREDEYC